MRAQPFIALAFWIGLTASAASIPYVPPPEPVYEAPIDRALENIAADTSLAPAQREQLLGRLNLLAYARNDPRFTYLRSDNRLNLSGDIACTDVARMHRSMRPDGAPDGTFAPEDRCANLDFHLGPQREILDAPQAQPTAAALDRLRAARTHYAQAVRLDRTNLRARLGYAYVLDRSGPAG